MQNRKITEFGNLVTDECMDDKLNNDHTFLYFSLLYFYQIRLSTLQLSIFNIFPCTFLFTTIQT